MTRTTTGTVRYRLLLVACCCLTFTLIAMANSGLAAVGNHAETIANALAEGDLHRAREALAAWLVDEPRNGHLHYNMACLTAKLNEPDPAVDHLYDAFALGFDDVRLTASDPDLENLHAHEGYRRLLADTEETIARTAQRRRLDVTSGLWRPLVLHDAQGDPATACDARLRVSGTGFEIEMALPAGALHHDEAPWYRGGGVVLTLAAPDSGEVFDTRRTWRFGFGMREGIPTGAILSMPDQRLDQLVMELAPAIARDPDTGGHTVVVSVPWAYLAPYGPPTDTNFGINLSYVPAPEAPIARLDLVADPRRARREPTRRRFVPLTLPDSPGGGLLFGGRVPNTIVGTSPLNIEMIAWSPHANTGRIATTIRDSEGNSVVASGGQTATVDLAAGRNTWRRQADLSQLLDGPYDLEAVLELTDGTRHTWRSELFRFRGEWLHRTHDRTKTLTAAERPSIQWRLALVSEALLNRDRRSSPTAVFTTVAETEHLLANHAATGFILEPGTETMLAHADAKERLHNVAVSTPPSWRSDTPTRVVILDLEAEFCDEIAANRRAELGAASSAVLIKPGTLENTQRLAGLIAWTRALIPQTTVLVVSPAARLGSLAEMEHVTTLASDGLTPGGIAIAMAGFEKGP